MTKRVVTALPERDRVSQCVSWPPRYRAVRRSGFDAGSIGWSDEARADLVVLDVGCSEGILEVLLARRGLIGDRSRR